MVDLDEYQTHRKAAETRRRRHDPRKPQRKGSRLKRFLLRFLMFVLMMLAVGGVLGYVGFNLFTAKYQKWAEEFNLEDINNLDHPCIIYDRNGEEIGRIFDENRSYVTYDKISPSMIDALVAQEDKTFWTHHGFDPMGILRAAKETLARHGDANQGASTITQQLARNAYDLERRTHARGGSRYERKVVEIFLARRIEDKYDKRQIMEFYLNRIYFGRGYYGIRAASLGYFGKEPADLTVREAASLAALIKNPENYNPIKNKELNRKWRNDVIDRMQRLHYLTSEEAERMKQMPLELNPKPLRRQTSHLHALVQQQAIDIFQNPERGEEIVKSAGLKVYTTIDKAMQEAAESSLRDQLAAIESRADYAHPRFDDGSEASRQQHRYLDGAVYAVDNATGATLVYVAGRSFERDNYDMIEHGRRPVGTALLPFVYMCAFENGYSPCSRLVDDALDNRLAGIGGSEGILGEWGMEVGKGRYLDSITARQALGWSKIAASARLGVALSSGPTGSKPFVNTLTKLGLTPPPRNPDSTEAHPLYYPRVYLGTEPMYLKEMVLAYTVFPNRGSRPVKPYIITKITDSNGSILWQNPLDVSRGRYNGTTPCTAFRIHSILKDSLEKGSAVRVRPFLPASFKGAVKSGTNYDFADNSIFGYTSDITCGVWLGFLNDRTPIYPQAFASDTCAPILGAVLNAAENRFPNKEILPPADTEEVEICTLSGQEATNFCFESVMNNGKVAYVRPTYREYFPKGDVSLTSCSIHGDGSPSLGDFLELGLSHTGSSRILPIVPVLPKGPALEGKDPYGCELELNPRYRNAEDLAQSNMDTAEDVGVSADSSPGDPGQTPFDSEIELTAPRPMRTVPIAPLNL